MARAKKAKSTKTNGGPIGYEAQLWKAADALRSNMDAAEYKHVVLGLIFLKYISDAFDQTHEKLVSDYGGGRLRDDKYRRNACLPLAACARQTRLSRSYPS